VLRLGDLTFKRISRGGIFGVDDLNTAIAEFLAAWNDASGNIRP
jgi:hypothetical protein